MTNKKTKARLILDNGGGYTLQLPSYAHAYDDEQQVASDVAEWLTTGDSYWWDGSESEAMDLDPTDVEIRNGGYRVIAIDRATDTVASLAAELTAIVGWDNASRLAEALSQR